MSLMLRDIGLSASLLLVAAGIAYADRSGDPAAVRMQDGEYFDSGGSPSFKIAKDGSVDWYTYVGYVRYTANCMQCHGPAGLGSSFAPSLADSLKSLTYTDFLSTVANGKKDVNAAQQAVMPAFGTNRNVMCYTDPIYVYLRARSDGALGALRPISTHQSRTVSRRPKTPAWADGNAGGAIADRAAAVGLLAQLARPLRA